MSNNAHDLSKRLLNALDNSYNVVDMHAVNEIISILEKINITKELLETTRLGKHVNELRRKTSDPTLARRAKVLVKRWRDLVIPNATNSPGHTGGPGSNRSSAERQMRRLGTPLTSPALNHLSRVVSPAVNSSRPPSRPAWGGYESDSQDVILVDDDPPAAAAPPPPPPPTNKPITPVKRPTSPVAPPDGKKSKRDKKPKKRSRGHSRAGSGSEAPSEWPARNGGSPPLVPASLPLPLPLPPAVLPLPPPAASPSPCPAAPSPFHPTPRKNGCRPPVDAYSQLVNRMPPAGSKKVKTTKELLEEIQSRGTKPPSSPSSPGSPDVMLIEPDDTYPAVKVTSPVRNGVSPRRSPSPPLPVRPPLEDPRPQYECTCTETEVAWSCPARGTGRVVPAHVWALHHALLPGVNGTRAAPHPHRYAVRPPIDPADPALFTSVVPLYKYSDYADDYCVKNMSRVPICADLPWREFAPAPPSPPPPPSPPTPRPYPLVEEPNGEAEDDDDDEKMETDDPESVAYECPEIEAEMVGGPVLEPTDRLKEEVKGEEGEGEGERPRSEVKCDVKVNVESEFVNDPPEHRTVERTKAHSDLDGRTIYRLCEDARGSVPYWYGQTSAPPLLSLPFDREDPEAVVETALERAAEMTARDDLGRPLRPSNFTEWHECAQLGDLIALPYVVID